VFQVGRKVLHRSEEEQERSGEKEGLGRRGQGGDRKMGEKRVGIEEMREKRMGSRQGRRGQGGDGEDGREEGGD